MTTGQDYREQALALIPTLAARAAATEAGRRIPPETIAELKGAGLHRMLKPKRFGGAELGLDEVADVIATLARGCASTAWVFAIYNDHSILVAKFDPRAIEEVWGAGADPVISAGYHPSGTVERAAGGFRIAGTWGFASGCDYADWLLLGSMLPLTDGPPTGCLCLVPRREVEIDDNWHVMGLAGTGSKNIVTKGTFVPVHRVLPLPVANHGVPAGRTDLAPLHRLPHISTVPFLFGATGLGIAEGLLGSIVEYVKHRSSLGVRLAELQSMQLQIAESAAEIDCARMLMTRDLAEAMAAMREGRPLSLAEKARNRRDQAYMAKLCRRAVDRLFSTAGSRGNFDDHEAQRKFRDMCAVSTHISASWEISGTIYGRVSFGMDPASFLI